MVSDSSRDIELYERRLSEYRGINLYSEYLVFKRMFRDDNGTRDHGVTLDNAMNESLARAQNLMEEKTEMVNTYADRYDELPIRTRLNKAFLTRGQRFGTAPIAAGDHDTIWIVPGASDLLILRPVGDSGRFQLIGPAYLHGFDLESVLQNEKLTWQDIVLKQMRIMVSLLSTRDMRCDWNWSFRVPEHRYCISEFVIRQKRK
jgi:hypothetical protein